MVRVETQPNGSGTVVAAQNLTAGNSITVYAIQRDAANNFVANVAADSWTLSGSTGGVVAGDLVPSGDKKSAVITGHVAGTATVRAVSGSLINIDSGIITVVAGSPAQVRVETAANGGGTVVPAQTLIAGRSITVYAIRRDAYANFVDNVAASAWSLPTITGSVVAGDLVPAVDSKSAVFTANGTGTATVRASSGALTATDSGVLNVVQPVRAAVVISQVYGGGGNSGGQYANDFVELFNRTSTNVSLAGWSLQYAGSAAAFTTTTNFCVNLPSVNIAPYSYFLVQLAPGANTGAAALPTPDAGNTNIAVSATGGKVALANTTNALGTVVLPDARVVDLVAFGSGSTPAEGTGPAPAPSNTTADFRGSASDVANGTWGCIDNDNNALDFVTAAPNPHNSASPQNICSAQTPPTISAIANQSIDSSVPVGPISFNVGDAETAPANLIVTASSSNPTLLPNNQITLGGSGIVRNITLNPVSGQTGTALVTVTVTDTDNMTATSSFDLFVGSGPQLGILFSENFDEYPDGTSLSFANNSPWFHSSGTNYELIVSNFSAQVSLYLTNSEDLYATFPSGPFTATSGDVLYIGFTLKQTVLPGANGDYFIHLRDAAGTNFVAKVFASIGSAGSGKFRLGLSNRANNPPNVQFPLDLSLNTTYNVVVRYKVSVGSSTIWVNPTSPNDVGATATDPLTPFDVTGIGIRESGTPSAPTAAGSQIIDNIVVSTSFSDVTTVAPSLTAARSASAIQISWPTNNNSAYVLQNAGTVNAASWNAVGGVSVSGTNYTVTVPFGATPGFFRLKH